MVSEVNQLKKYTMFIDETGTAEGMNTFGVAGVVFENKYAYNEDKTIITPLKSAVDKFKRDCFGRDDFVFHLEQISGGKEPFRSQDGVTRSQIASFWKGLPSFLQNLDFKVIFVSVDKVNLNEYFAKPKDPYVVAFAHIMKSFLSLISNSSVESARIVMESRDDFHNFKIQKAFFDIFHSGTVHLDITDDMKEKIKGFVFLDKDNYHPGLEIADLVCNPLSRVKSGKVEANPKRFIYGKTNRIFPVLQPKIYIGKSGHSDNNWGFKKIPVIHTV